MPEAPKVLAEGQLANSKGTLYTVPAGVSFTRVTAFVVYNTGGSTETVQIYVKPGSTSRTVRRLPVDTLTTAEILSFGQEFILENGDLIEGATTTATTVDYVIMGYEHYQ